MQASSPRCAVWQGSGAAERPGRAAGRGLLSALLAREHGRPPPVALYGTGAVRSRLERPLFPPAGAPAAVL